MFDREVSKRVYNYVMNSETALSDCDIIMCIKQVSETLELSSIQCKLLQIYFADKSVISTCNYLGMITGLSTKEVREFLLNTLESLQSNKAKNVIRSYVFKFASIDILNLAECTKTELRARNITTVAQLLQLNPDALLNKYHMSEFCVYDVVYAMAHELSIVY